MASNSECYRLKLSSETIQSSKLRQKLVKVNNKVYSLKKEVQDKEAQLNVFHEAVAKEE